MSTYIAPVIELSPEKHPDADSLSIQKVGGWTVCIKTSDWMNEDGSLKHKKAAYIEPDTLVTKREEFKWLWDSGVANLTAEQYRVKAKKLRGVSSFGFLIPVSDDKEVGQNLWEELELDRWQPPEPSDNGQSVKPPRRDFSKYDLENIKNYTDLFEEGEYVYAFEKIHGQNMRVTFQEDQIFVGSRSMWKANVPGSDFWNSFKAHPTLEYFIRDNPHYCVFGESYGNVPGFAYDCKQGERKFACFDILDTNTNKWLSPKELIDVCGAARIPTAPLLYEGPFNMDKVFELAEGKSTLNTKHVREGVVVSPAVDRTTTRGQRVKLKCVGLGYFERKEK